VKESDPRRADSYDQLEHPELVPSDCEHYYEHLVAGVSRNKISCFSGPLLTNWCVI